MITEAGDHASGRSGQRLVNELRARIHPDGGNPRRTFGTRLAASNPDLGIHKPVRPDGAGSAPLAQSLVLCPLSQGVERGHARS